MKNHKTFKAFTLLEVVFAVVILGIVVTGMPALLMTDSNSAEESLKQESFSNAFAAISLVNTEYWDENSTKGDNYYKALAVSSGDTELDCSSSSTNKRIGKTELDNGDGRICATDTSTYKASAIGIDADENSSDSSTFDDVDDFNDFNITNLSKYEINISVSYLDDDANYSDNNITFNLKKSSDEKNIKLIQVNVYDKSGHIVSRLEYFTSNIGLSSISKRDF